MPPPLLSFRNVSVHGCPPRLAASARRFAAAVLWLERAPADAELSLHFVRPARMRALSAERRGVDRPTDVLTAPGSGSGTPEERWLSAVLRAEESAGERRAALLDIGEIYFCVEYVWAQCVRRPGRNLPLLAYIEAALVHALLHALGYDHNTPQEWKRMSQREKHIRAQLAMWRQRWPGDLLYLEDAELLRRLRIEC